MLKLPGTKQLKLKFDELLLNFAFKINLRRYIMAALFATRLQQSGLIREVGPGTKIS
jgi:hypothetical protein